VPQVSGGLILMPPRIYQHLVSFWLLLAMSQASQMVFTSA
jgi:hypothetical protein